VGANEGVHQRLYRIVVFEIHTPQVRKRYNRANIDSECTTKIFGERIKFGVGLAFVDCHFNGVVGTNLLLDIFVMEAELFAVLVLDMSEISIELITHTANVLILRSLAFLLQILMSEEAGEVDLVGQIHI